MTTVRFPYKQIRGKVQPIIPIGMKLGETWKRFEAYVDSGATYTLIQAQQIDPAFLDFRTGERVAIQVGSGSTIAVYLHQIQLQLGTELLTCPVGISDQLGIRLNVLGKAGIFDRFHVCFRQSQRSLLFEKIEVTGEDSSG